MLKIQIKNKKRLYYLIIDIILLLFMIKVYRPYIYINAINDFHIADSIPSFLGVLIMSNIIYLNEKNLDYNFLLYLCPTVGLIIYEFLQYAFKIGTFDINDIVFTLIGGIIVFFYKRIFLV